MPPLTNTTSSVSTKNCRTIERRVAPSALRTPISRVRSRTATSITFITPMPPMKSVAMPTAPRKYFMPSVIVRKAFASSTVSQMLRRLVVLRVELVDPAERAAQLALARLVLGHRRGASRAAGPPSPASAGGLFGKSCRIALNGTKTLPMSRPS